MISQESEVVFAMVAGEISGDILGADLIKALRQYYPNAYFTGIGGPRMIAENFKTLYSMEKLSVMGIVEVFGRLHELLGIRRSLCRKFSTNKPIAFIGIDSPDFNLGIESKLKKAGVTTFHYVSPSVWAWRQKRVFKIRNAVDHLLALLPFEANFYKKYNVPVTFTGHPLADKIPMKPDVDLAKRTLGYKVNDIVIGLLPGSRAQEVKRLAPVFLETARAMRIKKPDLHFIIPAANEYRYQQIQTILTDFSDIEVKLIQGNSHQVMAASDALLLASGTAAFEGMLYKKPMVVSYKLPWITWKIANYLVNSPWCSLPNILSQKTLVPEILQDEATPERLADEVLNQLACYHTENSVIETFYQWHARLKKDASSCAATAIHKVIQQKRKQVLS